MTIYRPHYYYDDGTNMGWGDAPEELDGYAFESKDDCVEWLKDNGYDPEEYSIINEEIDGEDEEYIIIDGSGYVLDEWGNVSKANTAIHDM